MIIDVNRNAAFGRYFFWVADRYFDLTRFELSMQANENKRPRKVGPLVVSGHLNTITFRMI